MSIGPFYGRKKSRRKFNSLLGSNESYHQWLFGDSSFGTTNDADEGYHHIGLRDMDTIFSSAVHSGSGHSPLHSGVDTTSTIAHPTFSGVVNYTTETHGGGTVGLSSQPTTEIGRGINRTRMYDIGGQKSQSNYPYFKPMFDMHDNLTAMEQSTIGYGNVEAQGFRDVASAGAQWRYRQIISQTYTGGGYKDGSPWREVHRTKHTNDQTSNLGQILDYPGSYTAGWCNDTTFFLLSTPTDSAHQTVSVRTSAIHMWTETGKTYQSVFDMYNGRADLSCTQKEHELAFCTGQDASVSFDVFNMNTETRVANFSNGIDGDSSGFQDKDYGYHWDDGASKKVNFYTFSAANVTQLSSHGQQKGINSKHRLGYCGNEGTYNGGHNYRRWNLTNDTNQGNVGKIVTGSAGMGEENYGMGMDWQYMIGEYDGLQNNLSHKLYYATDTGPANPSGTSPSAHAGQSSGHCAWRG